MHGEFTRRNRYLMRYNSRILFELAISSILDDQLNYEYMGEIKRHRKAKNSVTLYPIVWSNMHRPTALSCTVTIIYNRIC